MNDECDILLTPVTSGHGETLRRRGDSSDARLARIAKALGHPARVRIVRMLLAQPACSGGHIFDSLPLAQSTVSQHLKVLREAGIVGYEPRGTRGCYWVRSDTLAEAAGLLGMILEGAKPQGRPDRTSSCG